MKKLLCAVLLAIAICNLYFTLPALADTSTDLAKGAKVFSANCAACHLGGNNVVVASKNLKAAALKQYGMDSADAIIAQVTNGKNAMPAFKSRLKEDEIKAVAAYVLDQSATGWK